MEYFSVTGEAYGHTLHAYVDSADQLDWVGTAYPCFSQLFAYMCHAYLKFIMLLDSSSVLQVC